jgi:CBS domain-containing protein
VIDEPSTAQELELKGLLETVTVGDLTRSGYPVLEPRQTVRDAVAAMRQCRHGSAIVCENGRLVGIFTERDLLRVLRDGGVESSMADVMTRDPRTVVTTDSLSTATAVMDRGGYRRLPVLDPDGKPVGVLDVKAIIHRVVEHFPDAIYNQATHAQLIARHREGA